MEVAIDKSAHKIKIVGLIGTHEELRKKMRIFPNIPEELESRGRRIVNMEVYIAYWVWPEEIEENNGILGVFTDLKKAENSIIKDMKEYLGADWHDKYFSDKDLVSDEEEWYYFVKESNIQWYVHKTKVR